MKDTSNDAIIELAKNAKVLQPENEQDNGYRYFTLDKGTYAIYPGRKNDSLFRVQNPENVEVNASQRENIVNGLEKKLSLNASKSSSFSTTPEKSSSSEELYSSGNSSLSSTPPKSSPTDDDEIDPEVLELAKKSEERKKRIELLDKEIKECDKNIQQGEKNIQQGEKNIQQVKEWEKKELQRLNNEQKESDKRLEKFSNEKKEELKQWKEFIVNNTDKKKSGCTIL